jgi:prepilin-type N-terminal cleavage/methylation domain-containing protein
MKLSKNMPRESGFTLLELLVALSLTALVVAAVTASFMTWVRAQERAELAMEKMRSLDFAITRMRETVGTSYMPLVSLRPELYAFKGEFLERPSEPFDALTFDSVGHREMRTDAKQSDLAEMTLFTVANPALDDGDKCRILKMREGGNINDRFEVEGGMVYDLAYDVSRFQLRYLGPDGNLQQDWNLAEKGSMPCAVVAWIRSGCAGDDHDECVFIPLKLTNAPQCVFDPEQFRSICEIPLF